MSLKIIRETIIYYFKNGHSYIIKMIKQDKQTLEKSHEDIWACLTQVK